MEKMLHYWKQGWKFQLAMLIFNICVAVILVPVVWMLKLDKQSYYAVAMPIYVLVLVPIGGYLSWRLRPKEFISQNTETNT
jgi:hypothetical protein